LEQASYGTITAHRECVSNVTGPVYPPAAESQMRRPIGIEATVEGTEPGRVVAVSCRRLFRPNRLAPTTRNAVDEVHHRFGESAVRRR
jgi:hypothetical protein